MSRLRFWWAMARANWQLYASVLLLFGGLAAILSYQAQRNAAPPLTETRIWASLESSAALQSDDGPTRFHLQLRAADGTQHVLTTDQINFAALDPERICLRIRTYASRAPSAALAREDLCR